MQFVMVSKSDCRFCTEAKLALSSRGLNYTVYDLDNNEYLKAFIKDLGFATVPQVWIKSEAGLRSVHIGGYIELKDYLDEKSAAH